MELSDSICCQCLLIFNYGLGQQQQFEADLRDRNSSRYHDFDDDSNYNLNGRNPTNSNQGPPGPSQCHSNSIISNNHPNRASRALSLTNSQGPENPKFKSASNLNGNSSNTSLNYSSSTLNNIPCEVNRDRGPGPYRDSISP